ncbi:MAG: RICIN domain-containing protein [Verrucomicrobiota bacterium]
MALIVGLGIATSEQASAIGAGDADASINAFNSAFLVNSGGQTYYKVGLNNSSPAYFWEQALNIQGMQDAYERTGSTAHRTQVNNLCNTFLQQNPPPWTWNGWNDDLGWASIALVRGYQMTGNTNLLTQARYGFDLAWNRGWDTQYNGGGIWEHQPDYPGTEPDRKEALSNNSLGKAACMIYQSTGDTWYRDRATEIYNWVWHRIYNATTGQVYTGVFPDGTVNTGAAVYNQGTFVDFANLMYQITGNINYYNDAKRSIDYVRYNMTTNGIITNTAGWLNTWADEFARGLGHFARDNRQWATYHSWMVQNADAIWNNRRRDLNLTDNGWNRLTPNDPAMTANKAVSAVAWLQFTPASMPNNIGGIHTIVSRQNSIAIDNGGTTANGAGVIQWAQNNSQNQRWLFTQNQDTSWNIVNLTSWKALDAPGGSTANGLQMVQWTPLRNTNQRWWVDQQSDGSYRIWNQGTSKSLDNSSNATNGYKLIQWDWNGGNQQRWNLQ